MSDLDEKREDGSSGSSKCHVDTTTGNGTEGKSYWTGKYQSIRLHIGSSIDQTFTIC